MHRGAAAKVLLATLSPAKQAAYLARVVPTMGEKEVAALLEELAAVRRAGHAESSGEVDDGVWATAAAVHSRGKVVAAISVAAPQYRIGPQDRERIAGLVLDAAARLDRALATPA